MKLTIQTKVALCGVATGALSALSGCQTYEIKSSTTLQIDKNGSVKGIPFRVKVPEAVQTTVWVVRQVSVQYEITPTDGKPEKYPATPETLVATDEIMDGLASDFNMNPIAGMPAAEAAISKRLAKFRVASNAALRGIKGASTLTESLSFKRALDLYANSVSTEMVYDTRVYYMNSTRPIIGLNRPGIPGDSLV
jgi:hypothetical protein